MYFCLSSGNNNEILNGDVSAERYTLSLPGSPTEHKLFKGIVGSAESLVGKVDICTYQRKFA